MNKKNNADNQSKKENSQIVNKNIKNLSIKEPIENLDLEASISEIKDNKDLNNTGNILNVSYLSIINKKDKDNNFSGTTKNDEYKSTDNVSTKSKKKKLIKVFSDSGNLEIDKTIKYDYMKNSKDSLENNNVINQNYKDNEIKVKDTFNNDDKKNKITDYFSNDLVNKNSEDVYLKDSFDFFETENRGIGYKNICETFLQSENKLKNLVLKFEKSRTKSFINSHIRRNSNFSLNLNFKKELQIEKNLDQKYYNTNDNTEQNNINYNLPNYASSEALNNKKNDELDAHENLSNLELSKLIFEKINKNPDISEITLPAGYISLPFMNIKKNLKIKGSPGTLLEIKNGFIFINQNVSVSFSECSFVFNYEQRNFIEKLNSNSQKFSKIVSSKEEISSKNLNKDNSILINTIYKISCIKICENSQLEINDCDFRSIVHENEEIFERETKQIRETLISCTLSDENIGSNNAKLILNSCIFSNFNAIVEADFLKFICVDNCHFSEISSTVFSVRNFLELTLENSIITNVKNAVEILDCVLIKMILKMKITIKIKGCQIYLNEKDAITLKNSNTSANLKSNNLNKEINENNNNNNKNNNFNALNLSKHLSNKNNSTNDVIEISKNKILQNKGIGISIENYINKTYEIIENQIEENLQGNLLINGIHKYEHSSISSLSSSDTDALIIHNRTIGNNKSNVENCSNFTLMPVNYSEYDFIFLKNEIKNSYSAFGLKMLNCTNIKVLIEHNHIEKNLIGLHSINNNSLQLFIKNTSLNANLDSGVVLLNNKIKSNFNFLECCINKNNNFGIQANNNNLILSFSNNNNNKSNSNDGLINEIRIHKGEINHNTIGLGYESYLCKIDQCKFIDNKTFAIQINEERYKENLKLFNYERNYNAMINSPIGGSWGFFNNDKCVCQSGKCVIF